MKRIIRIVIFTLALVLMIGSAGALEAENIGFGQCLLQCGLCVLAMWLAVRKYD